MRRALDVGEEEDGDVEDGDARGPCSRLETRLERGVPVGVEVVGIRDGVERALTRSGRGGVCGAMVDVLETGRDALGAAADALLSRLPDEEDGEIPPPTVLRKGLLLTYSALTKP